MLTPMLLLTLSLAAAAVGGNGPTHRDPPRSMLGVKLRPAVRDLLREVEKLFGREVTAEFLSRTSEDDDHGHAVISEDGAPTIQVSDKARQGGAQMVESIIAHELLHLRLRAGGYPTVLLTGPTDLMTEFGPHMKEVSNRLRNGLEHWSFAPEMRRMGFSEVSVLKTGKARVGEAAREGRGDDILLALHLYRAVLEYDDPPLLADLRRNYSEGRRYGAIKKADALAQIVTAGRPRTPEEFRETLLRLHATAYSPLFVFSRLPDVTETAGKVRLSRLHLQVSRRVN